jgi:hypothetical protein
MKRIFRYGPLLIGVVFSGAVVTLARADGGNLTPRNVPPAYTQECAACHLAYPPGLLPARSWQRIMSGLDKHYGTDASLDAAAAQPISAWLIAYAGTHKRAGESPPDDRITRSIWFERKHRKVGAAVWKLASVKSPANCAACHGGAARGDFDDDNLTVPSGLDVRLRRPWTN